MKTIIKCILILAIFSFSCNKDDDEENNNITPPDNTTDYKQEMRSFVKKISQYARNIDSDFIIIPQNGQEIITQNGEENGPPATDYLNAIDGVGREDLFYGYNNDNEPTPVSEKNYLMAFLDICELHSVEVLTTDYCSSHAFIDDSYVKNSAKGYTSFAAPDRELRVIPDYPAEPWQVNTNDIEKLSDAKNFLYLINPENFNSKQSFINALSHTNYDLIIIDCFFDGDEEYTVAEINSLKTKENGGARLIISYLSIGEAEDYRYYWENAWNTQWPSWIETENPDWPGNYIVKYWESEWMSIIYGNNNAYLNKILDAGFDGAYLDIIDAFEYFEGLK